MKVGDIVSVSKEWHGVVRHTPCVVLMVTPKMIRQGINADRPGLHLFRGYWYGTDPLSVRCYGKIEGTIEQNKHAKYIGHVQSHEQIKKLGV